MVFIGAAILPNGSMILDPTMEEVPDGVDELHHGTVFDSAPSMFEKGLQEGGLKV